MESVAFIPMYTAILVTIIMAANQRQAVAKMMIAKIKKRGQTAMTNDIIKKHIGSTCMFSTGTLGANATGTILDVQENWVEIQTKKGIQVINAEFVQQIKVIKKPGQE